MTIRRWIGAAAGVLAAALGICTLAPEALAFPYHRVIGDTQIYGEVPIAPEMERVLARSDALLRRSAIYGSGYGRRIFLTQGGWCWHRRRRARSRSRAR